MKKILGLDLGTNSIGWALIEIDHENGTVKILGLGSRILPMDAGEINDFESKGAIKSSASQRTADRGVRRNNERYLLRRDRLHLVLNLLDALPEHYKVEIDFTNKNGEKCGQFKPYKEPKLAYTQNKTNPKKNDFLFEDSYKELLQEIGIEYKRRKLIPRDWTLYYLRQKALDKKISLEELAWVLLSYNQKRGYEKIEVEDKATKENEIVEELDLTVKKVTETLNKKGQKFFKVELDSNDNLTYNEYSEKQMTFEGDLKEVIISSQIDEETNKVKGKEFSVVDIYTLKIANVDYEKDGGKHCFTLTYDNEWVEEKAPVNNYTSKYSNAINKEFEYIVKTVYDDKGNIKPQKGKERNYKAPDYSENSDDWTLLKKKTEKEALAFNIKHGYVNKETNEPKKFISTRIFDILKNDAQNSTRTKIIGGMFQVVEREFYREELNQIISTQKQFHNSLDDAKIFEDCVRLLYPKNESHAKTLLSNKDALQHLLIEDILLYQRPLKTKKSEIADCKYEVRYWKDVFDKKTKKPIEDVNEVNGEVFIKKEPVFHKVVSASHPYFQEFRIWDKLHNLRLIQIEKEIDGKTNTNVDVTDEYFNEQTYQELFDHLNNKKSLKQTGFLTFLKKQFKERGEDSKNFVWNFPEDEELKGNETRVSFAIRFNRCGFTDYADFLTQEKEIALWHYLYSVSYKERMADDYKSIRSFFKKYFDELAFPNETIEKLVEDFANYPKFASKYCAYSEKALKKLIPFIRLGINSFKGSFNISEYKTELESIDYDAKKISELLKSFGDKESGLKEQKKQQLYKAIWEHSINERISEIKGRLKTIDYSLEELDYSKAVCNDNTNGNIPFPKGLFNAFRKFEDQDKFTNLNLTQASYLVYGRHSELAQAKYWNSPKDIREELHQELKQHSLNNPIAEKVILEMMQVVADIWEYYAEKNVDDTYKKFDEIHLEVGRDFKKSAKEKKKITEEQKKNKAQNKRLRQTLEEFLSQSPYNAIPQNADHFERLKIAEDGASHTKNTDKKFFDDKPYTKKEIEDILKKPDISKEDFNKYKLWVEQGYKSPYTNKIIKLTDLFNGDKYNVDHVFPQASVTNDSLSNKVVCEKEVNILKSKQTGREFVNAPKQRNIYCLAYNSEIEIIDDRTYVDIVNAQFSGSKRHIMLSKEIPSSFTSSQLNNTRHIARKAMELLSHIVREEGEVEFRSKNVLPVTGAITSKLKREWKLDEVWKELVAPRFIRMNELTNSCKYGRWRVAKSGERYFDCNIIDSIREKNPAYNIKRIDHRHHALDALIVALCTPEHVNYENNINANAKSDSYGKQKQIEKYRTTLKRKIKFSKPNKEKPQEKDWFYMLPGQIREKNVETFGIDTVLQKAYSYKESEFDSDYKDMVLSALQNTIVTFKQNLRVINNTVNKYQSAYNKVTTQNTENGRQKNWSIRRSLGKGTMYGKLDIGERTNKQLLKNADFFYDNIDAIVDNNLKDRIGIIKEESSSLEMFEEKLKEKFKNIKIECIAYKAVSRYNSDLDISFNREKIKTVVDKGIQRILINRLNEFDTIELPFEIALDYYDSVLEKPEIEFLINNEDSSFNDVYEFLEFLKVNDYKYKKEDYTKLNVFIEQVPDKDFRKYEDLKDKIIEHPEIAFTPERIDEMNDPDVLFKLNNGKHHKPIRKMKTYTSFGKERRVSNNELSKKYNQYVKVDKGTNFYIAMYEIEDQSKISKKCPVRVFKEISLFDLIEYQKSTNSFDLPIEKRIYHEGEEYKFLFTLTQNDIVAVDIKGEELIYAFNRFSEGDIYFRPVNHAAEIEKYEVDRKINERTGKLGGSQVNETTSILGKQIKNICWKLGVTRLGNII